MATASQSHMPDLSASLSDSHSCAPLSDLWNLPQSKLFPGIHASASGPITAAQAQAQAQSQTQAQAQAQAPRQDTQSQAVGHTPVQTPAAGGAVPSPGSSARSGPSPAPAPSGGASVTKLTSVSSASESPLSAPVSAAPGGPVSPVSLSAGGATPGSASGPTSGAATPTAFGAPASLWSRPASSGSVPSTLSSKGSLLGLAPSTSPTYRSAPATAQPSSATLGSSRGIWGPRDDFNYRQQVISPFAAAAGPAHAASGTHAHPHAHAHSHSHTGAVSGPGAWGALDANGGRGFVPGQGPANLAASPVGGAPGSGHSSHVSRSPQHMLHQQGAHMLGPQPSHGGLQHHGFVSQHGHPGVNGGAMNGNGLSLGSQIQMAGPGPIGAHAGSMAGRTQKKPGRPSTNTELYKTELCASYISTGGNCPYGDKCQFAHGTQELKTVDRPPKWRSKPCQNWVKTGSCSYNERCCFRHDMPLTSPQ